MYMLERTDILKAVGSFIARGYTHNQIIEALEEEGIESPLQYIRDVYDSWEKVRSDLHLNTADLSNWHTTLRLELLRRALEDTSAVGIRLALSILDSLSALQGLTKGIDLGTQDVPLTITILPKPELEKGNAQ